MVQNHFVMVVACSGVGSQLLRNLKDVLSNIIVNWARRFVKLLDLLAQKYYKVLIHNPVFEQLRGDEILDSYEEKLITI